MLSTIRKTESMYEVYNHFDTTPTPVGDPYATKMDEYFII